MGVQREITGRVFLCCVLAYSLEIRVLTVQALVLCESEFALTKGLCLEHRHSNLFTVVILPLVINSVDKPNVHSFLLPTNIINAASQFLLKLTPIFTCIYCTKFLFLKIIKFIIIIYYFNGREQFN